VIVLDTDHVSVLKYKGSDRYNRLVARLAVVDEPWGPSVISVEEQMRGWLATIAKEQKAGRQVGPYRELAALFHFFEPFRIIPFDEAAAARFDGLTKVRARASDKKIAAVALANDALLLTANRQDFEKVPGLRFENWMDP
jgi:tRNA(fMet)-specific endonuclease VapC